MAVIQEACIQGVSTRAVDDLVRAMGLTGTSKSQVSRLCEAEPSSAIGPRTMAKGPAGDRVPRAPARRRLAVPVARRVPHVKLRENHRIVSMAVIVAVAVSTDGRREVLGITVMPSEAETFWSDFLRSLTRRGLRGVQMVISDAHEGLKAAARKVLGAGWQRCRGDCPEFCALAH